METTLLRSCLALPKFSYTLRTCPPSHITKATSEFDAAMRESLEAILGGPISDWSWLMVGGIPPQQSCPAKTNLEEHARILQESCMQDLLATCTRYVPFLHNLAPILARSCKKSARNSKLAGNYSCSISCKILHHFLQESCKIVQELCKILDISRARAKQVLHARFLQDSYLASSFLLGGGVNLRSAAKHAPAAFIASSAQSRGLVEKILAQPPDLSPHLDLTVSAPATAASQPDWQQLEVIDVPLRQHHLSRAIDESVHQQLLSSASSPRDRALALSTTLPHAGDWLNCVPSSALGLHLQDREFCCCLRYWLGIPLHSGPYTCPECRHTADEHGDHQVGCGGNGDRITRHNAIRDVLFSAAQSAALAPSREAAGVVPA